MWRIAWFSLALALGGGFSLKSATADDAASKRGPCGPGHAYYVAGEDERADDANPGTLAAPFRTINGALKALAGKIQPGDTIWIRKGTYRESVALAGLEEKNLPVPSIRIASGTSYSEMITLAAYPGEKPVLKGSDVVTGWTRDEGDVWVKEGWTYPSQQVFANDQLLMQIGGNIGTGYVEYSLDYPHKKKTRGDMFAGSFYHDAEAKKLYVWLPDGTDPNTVLIEADARPSQIAISEVDYIRIGGLTLRHGSGPGITHAIWVNGRFCIVDHIDQAWNGFSGCSVGGEYLTFSHCKFNCNGNTGMNGRHRGHRLFFNETSYNNYRNWSTGLTCPP